MKYIAKDEETMIKRREIAISTLWQFDPVLPMAVRRTAKGPSAERH